MIETIKLWGAIAGLATAAFTIWDRLIRIRPRASLYLTGSPTNAIKSIRIKNIAPIDILISGIRVFPGRLRIAADDSMRGIIHSIVNGSLLAILRPDEVRDFPMFANPSIDENERNRRVLIAIFWRKSSSTWIKQVPKIILTSTKDLELMARGLMRNHAA